MTSTNTWIGRPRPNKHDLAKFRDPASAQYRGRPNKESGLAIITWRWIDTITKELELCNAAAGETVVVLATDEGDPTLRNVVCLSLERLGCRVSEVVVRSGSVVDQGDPVDNEAVAAALLHSDLIVDLSGNLVEQSGALDEILDEARVLVIDVTAAQQLDALVAHPGLSKRLERAAELLTHTQVLTVSTDAGTSLRLEPARTNVRLLSGTAATVGDIAHWPSGIVWIGVGDSKVNGSIVAMPGDLIAGVGHVMRSPVRVEVEDGRLVDVLGDTADADVLRSYLESFNDESAYQVTEFGWGMNLTRHAWELDPFDTEHLALGRGVLAAGRVNLATGTPDEAATGITLSLANAWVLADTTEVVSNGNLEGALAPDIYERAAIG